jgi:hypothetical protein
MFASWINLNDKHNKTKKKNYSYSDRLKTNSNFSAINAIVLELLAQGNARKGVFQSAMNRTLNLFPILHFLQTK